MLRFFLLVYYLSSATSSEHLSRHKRTWIIDSFSMEEEHPGPFPYVLGKIEINRDYQIHFDIFGEGVDEEPMGVLSIHEETGILSVHRAVDYEEKKILKLKFEARKADLSIDTNLGIEITILDINDNPPRFQRDLYEIRVAEEAAQGSNLLTVVAYDRDERGTPNSTIHYEIKSVSPNPSDTEFFIDDSGTISFKGCLDNEVAERFTVLVEAKDSGEVVKLSSSTTVIIFVQDGNNHLPVISGQTGSGKVKEGETGASPLRLHVIDKDTLNSPAWRAKYTIHGDEGGHFKIETDPETNDGILTVVKPLNFEEASQRQLSISVENEVPYITCKVKEKTSSGLWKVETIRGDPVASRLPPVNVLIEVEDTNDPPVFNASVKDIWLEENTPIGTWVDTVTAVDPDPSHEKDFVYTIGNDSAGWMTVDPHTGDITVAKIPDRESSHVVNGVYTIVLNAVDNGNPPMTGTTTIKIHLRDQNDNVPQPAVYDVEVCVSDSPTTTNITASDLDGDPLGGPFTFELLGNFQGQWKLNPSYGYTAGLVKEPGVYAGMHTINLKISDMQGVFGIYNISATVCNCSATPNCRSHRNIVAKVSPGAIGVIFAALFILLFLMLLAVKCSCKKEFTTLHTGDFSGDTLLQSNIEEPGKDCMIPDNAWAVFDKKHHDPSDWQSQYNRREQGQASTKDMKQRVNYGHFGGNQEESVYYRSSEDWNQTTWNSQITRGYRQTQQAVDRSTMNFLYNDSSHATDAFLLALIHRRLSCLRETEDDLLEHQPHLYADEGDGDNLSELENITIPDDDTFESVLKDLGPEFFQIASICKPPHA